MTTYTFMLRYQDGTITTMTYDADHPTTVRLVALDLMRTYATLRRVTVANAALVVIDRLSR